MAEMSDTFNIVYQNLKDAGCDRQTADKCMDFFKQGNYQGLLLILSDHRKTLLGTIRLGQKRIDCLDYLIYKIQKEKL